MTIDEIAINPLHISLEAKIECDHLHQEELQQARKEWLREEIVRLEGMKVGVRGLYPNADVTIPTDLLATMVEAKEKYNQALQTIIDRYEAELNKK